MKGQVPAAGQGLAAGQVLTAGQVLAAGRGLAVALGICVWAPARAAERLDCPEGTRVVDVPQLDGSLRQCQLPDGTAHGPSQRLDPTGRVRARGFYEAGVEQGSWRHYDSAGRILRSGQMSAGRPKGAWTHFDPQGTPSATLTHGTATVPDAPGAGSDDPRVRWRRSLPSAASRLWRLDERLVAVAEGAEALWLIDLPTGVVRGRVPLPADLRADVVMAGDRMLAVTAPGELLVVDLEPEVPTWRRLRTPVGLTHVAGIHSDGSVVVRSGLGRVDGIDLDTGDQRWTSKLYIDEVAPVMAGPVVAAVRDAREVRAVTAGTGTFAWQARMGAPVADLLALGSRVHVLTRSGELLALDRQTGAPLWSIALGPGVAGALSVRDDALWVATPHAAWRVERRLGTVLEQYGAEPPFEEAAADLVVGGGLSCTTGRRGGLRCTPGGWELELPPSVVPPVLGEGIVLLADAEGGLLALDAGVGAAVQGMEAGGTTLVEDGVLVAEVRLGETTWEVELPWLLVEQPHVEDDCTMVTAAVGLPGQAEVAEWWAAESDRPADAGSAVPDDGTVSLFDVALQHDVGSGAFVIPDEWAVEDAGSVWRMSWWHRHRPTITALAASLGDASDAAEVEALLRCESGPAHFKGGVHLDDGYRTMEVTGKLEVVPHPHSLDGELGCLLDLAVGGEDLGAWSSPQMPAWSEVLLEIALPESMPELGEDADEVVFPEQVSGLEVVLDLYEPWQVERTVASASGAVELRIDAGDVRGPILRAFSGARLLAELPVPELRYGQVGESDDGVEVPTPEIEDILHLERPLPVSTGQTAWRVAWQRSECLVQAEEDPAEGGQDAQPEDGTPEAPSAVADDAPPPKPPVPRAPPRSRWRRDRSR